MICYTALLLFRLLEAKLNDNGTHFTAEEILETLRNMNVINCNDLYYQAIYTGSKICSELNNIFLLGLDKQFYQPKDLNKKIKKLLKQ
jgi:hypothetical protein